MRQFYLFVLLLCCFALARGQKDTIRLGLPLGQLNILSPMLSPDGKKFVICPNSVSSFVFSLKTFRLLTILNSNSRDERPLTFNRASNLLLTHSDTTVSLWDVNTGKLLRMFDHENGVSSATFLTKDFNIYTKSSFHLMKHHEYYESLWSTIDGTGTTNLTSSDFLIRNNPNYQRTLIGSDIYDNDSFKGIVSISDKADDIDAAAFSFNGSRLITLTGKYSGNSKVHIWETELTSTSQSEWEYKRDSLASSYMFVTLGYPEARLLNELTSTSTIWSATISLDGNKVLTADWDGKAKVWDAKDGTVLTEIQYDESALFLALFNPKADRVVTFGASNAKLWDAANGNLISDFEGESGFNQNGQYSEDGSVILTPMRDGTLKVWEGATGKLLFTFILFKDTDYLIVDPESHYDGTENACESIFFICKKDTFYSELLADELRIPNLAQKILNKEFISDYSLNRIKSCDTLSLQKLSVSKTGKEKEKSTSSKNSIRDGYNSYILTLPLGHTDVVNYASFSRNGKYLVTASDDNTAKIWDVQSGKLLRTFTGHKNKLKKAELTADNKHILTLSEDYTVKIWNAENGALEKTVGDLSNTIKTAILSPGATTFLSTKECSYNSEKCHTANIWKLDTSTIALQLKGHTGAIINSTYSKSGNYLLTVSSDSTAKMWDVKNGKNIYTFRDTLKRITIAKFIGSKSTVLTITEDGSVKVWDSNTCKSKYKINQNNTLDEEYPLQVSSNAKLIAIIDKDSTVKIFDAFYGTVLYAFKIDLKAQYGYMDFSSDNRYLSLRDGTHRIVVFDLAAKQSVFELNTSKLYISHVGFSEDCKRLVVCEANGRVGVWDYKKRIKIASLENKIRTINTIDISEDGKKVLIENTDGIKTWDFTKTTEAQNVADNNQHTVASVISPDGKFVATLQNDGITRIYDIYSHRNFVSLIDDSNVNISFLKFTPDSKCILSVTNPNRAKIWDLQSGKIVTHISFDAVANFSANFSRDQKYLATILDKKVRIWDLESGTIPIEIGDPKKGINYVSFSPDSKEIATIDEKKINIWDISTGSLVKTLEGEYDYSANDDEKEYGLSNLLLPDFRQKVFDALGKNISIAEHPDDVLFADFGSNGEIISSSRYENIKVWDTKLDYVKKRIKEIAGNITDAKLIKNNNYLFALCNNIQYKLWDIHTGKEVIKLLLLDSTSLVLINHDNYYFANTNSVSQLHYAKGLQTIGFDQLDVKYNRPDKVLTELGNAFGNPDTALINSYYKAWQKRVKKLGVDTTSFEEGFSVPEGDFKNRDIVPYEQTSTDGKLQLQVWGMDSTYKLDRFNIWVNEVPVFGQRGVNIRKDSLNTIERTVTVTLSEGENKIETSVLNINGIESYRVPLYVRYTPKQPAKEKLYFVGIGIDKYKQEGHNLQYSAKDIRDLAVKLKEQYGNDIEVDTLLDENVNIKNIKALKQRLLQSTVNDKVIVAFSGHGLLSKDYDYYLSTYNVKFNQPEQGGLPYEDLEWLLDSIPARKKLMLIDACHSGELDKEEVVQLNHNNDTLLAENKGTKGAYITYTGDNKRLGLKNSFELMQELFTNVNRGTGATVIAASGGTQFAQEHGSLKNGVFTYSILELMQQEKDVTVTKLKTTVGKRVEQLTNGNQKPTSRNENIEFDWKVW